MESRKPEQMFEDAALQAPGARAVEARDSYDERLNRILYPTHEAFIAEVNIQRKAKPLTTLYPEKRLYFAQNQPTTEVALRTSLFEDLYVILAGFEPSRIATFKVFVNPLVSWMWIGGLVIVLGTIVAIWPERRANLSM